VLKWVCQRVSGEVGARRTAIGLVPHARDVDLTGLDVSKEVLATKLLAVNAHEWMEEWTDMKKFLDTIESLPAFITQQLHYLEKRYTATTASAALSHLHCLADLIRPHSLQLELTKVPTTNRAILDWVKSTVKLCKPDAVRWCDGSEEEYHELCQLLCEKGTFVKLNDSLRPNSYLARSTEDDVARVEDRTFICSTKKEGTVTVRAPRLVASQLIPRLCVRCGSDQQLDGSGGDEGEAQHAVRRVHEGTHDVHHPVLHGPAQQQGVQVRH
jgi:GTP-dependent phosphoenolpyruvate carboxykinase